MMIPQKNTTIIHSTHSLTHSLIIDATAAAALLSSPLSLCLCLVQQGSDLSLPLQDLACKTACLPILLPEGFATSQDQHLSISFLKNSINQSGKFQSIN